MQRGPVFIVGSPRSGTSLLRVMLNRHPSICICDETYYFYYVYTRRRAFGDLRNLEARRHLISRYLATQRVRRLGLDLKALADVLMREGDNYVAFFASLLRFYALHHGGAEHIGEKTPHHALHAETLCDLFPTCALIHIVRDPRDVVGSLLRMPWASNQVVPNARLWVDCTVAAERVHDRDNYLRVQYERLVDEPESVLRSICAFIGESYDPAMLDAEEKASADKWWFQRAQEPLRANRVGTWEGELHPDQVALIERVAGDAMEQVGYEVSGRSPSLASLTSALAREYVHDVQQKVANLPRIWYHWMRPTHLAAEEAWIDRND